MSEDEGRTGVQAPASAEAIAGRDGQADSTPDTGIQSPAVEL